ncbi:MAG: hypothetical protein M3076_03385 [Actinomycetota bacterium]|nr:hypothetical protein [Actinomycetota bacterium]
MHLVFDIFTGVGLAAAVGIRPFLPALAAGALAAGDVEIHFGGTEFSFLQSAGFLLAMAVAAVLLVLAERRFGAEPIEKGSLRLPLGAVALALGALLFAGSLARGHYAAWPGIVGGVLCAAVAILATAPLLARVRARLDREAAGTLSAYAEGVALLLAVLSVVAPPVGLIGFAWLVWLALAGRRREGQKYAGLRILR